MTKKYHYLTILSPEWCLIDLSRGDSSPGSPWFGVVIKDFQNRQAGISLTSDQLNIAQYLFQKIISSSYSRLYNFNVIIAAAERGEPCDGPFRDRSIEDLQFINYGVLFTADYLCFFFSLRY